MTEQERLTAWYFHRMSGELYARGAMIKNLSAAYDTGHISEETWKVISSIYHEAYDHLEQPWAEEVVTDG